MLVEAEAGSIFDVGVDLERGCWWMGTLWVPILSDSSLSFLLPQNDRERLTAGRCWDEEEVVAGDAWREKVRFSESTRVRVTGVTSMDMRRRADGGRDV